MLRFTRVWLLTATVAAAGACTIFNAPADVIPPGGGGQGGTPSTSTSVTTSSTTSTSTTATGGSATCKVDADCPAAPGPCSAYSCGADGTCVLGTLADDTPCDDGKYCTVGDVCQAGACNGLLRSCPPKDACNVGVCDESVMACAFAVGNDGASCDDGNPCDNPGTCNSGTCQMGTDKCSSLETDCLSASCMTGVGCVTQNKSDGTTCGVTSCSTGICGGGHCSITAVDDGKTCDDGLYCTINDTCQSGYCVGMARSCSTGAQCVQESCDETSKSCVMMPITNGSPCNDGNACHGGATCNDQVCSGGTTPTTVFFDDFDTQTLGWTTGNQWQIGPARMSHGQNSGNADPANDHTMDAANGVAGVEIGGNALVAAPDPTHGPYYLTSPVIDTTPLSGSVYLTFWRWLNSDITPFMTNTVEASKDGTTWTVIWQSGGNPAVTDDVWTFQSFDVTAFKSTTSQYRFSFSIGAAGVFTVSSWNIDDVKVQNAPCSE